MANASVSGVSSGYVCQFRGPPGPATPFYRSMCFEPPFAIVPAVMRGGYSDQGDLCLAGNSSSGTNSVTTVGGGAAAASAFASGCTDSAADLRVAAANDNRTCGVPRDQQLNRDCIQRAYPPTQPASFSSTSNYDVNQTTYSLSSSAGVYESSNPRVIGFPTARQAQRMLSGNAILQQLMMTGDAAPPVQSLSSSSSPPHLPDSIAPTAQPAVATLNRQDWQPACLATAACAANPDVPIDGVYLVQLPNIGTKWPQAEQSTGLDIAGPRTCLARSLCGRDLQPQCKTCLRSLWPASFAANMSREEQVLSALAPQCFLYDVASPDGRLIPVMAKVSPICDYVAAQAVAQCYQCRNTV